MCGEQKETLQHLLSGCKKLAATEFFRRNDNALKIMAVERRKRVGLLPEKTRWYNETWEKGHVIEKDEKKISGLGPQDENPLQGQETGSDISRGKKERN